MESVVVAGLVLVALVVASLIVIAGRAAPSPSGWPDRARRFEGLVRHWSRERNLDPALVAAVIDVESGWIPSAVNPGDPSYGLMQVMVPTAREVRPGTTREDLMDPDINVEVGTAYLARLRDHYGVPLPFRVDAYNIGPGAYRQGRMNRQYRDRVLERMGLYAG